jgi:hypothetical protein
MDEKQLAESLSRIASALEIIAAARIHERYDEVASMEALTKNDGMTKHFAKQHPCPLCRRNAE